MFLLFFGVILATTYGSWACEYDMECGVNQFCYQKGSCYDCINCSVYKRQQPEVACVKDISQCGLCLPNYNDGYNQVNKGKYRNKYCIAADKSESVFQGTDQQPFDYISMLVVIFSVVFFIACLLVTIYLWIRCRKIKASQKKINDFCQRRTMENPPPYNASFRPSAPNVTVNVPEYESPQCIYVAESNKVKAIAFQPPDYIKPPTNDNESENQLVDADFMDENEELLLDESTQDSFWTPNAHNDSNASTGGDNHCSVSTNLTETTTPRPFESVSSSKN